MADAIPVAQAQDKPAAEPKKAPAPKELAADPKKGVKIPSHDAVRVDH